MTVHYILLMLTIEYHCEDIPSVPFPHFYHKLYYSEHTESDINLACNVSIVRECHLKLELLTQFPASNDEKYYYL